MWRAGHRTDGCSVPNVFFFFAFVFCKNFAKRTKHQPGLGAGNWACIYHILVLTGMKSVDVTLGWCYWRCHNMQKSLHLCFLSVLFASIRQTRAKNMHFRESAVDSVTKGTATSPRWVRTGAGFGQANTSLFPNQWQNCCSVSYLPCKAKKGTFFTQ